MIPGLKTTGGKLYLTAFLMTFFKLAYQQVQIWPLLFFSILRTWDLRCPVAKS